MTKTRVVEVAVVSKPIFRVRLADKIHTLEGLQARGCYFEMPF